MYLRHHQKVLISLCYLHLVTVGYHSCYTDMTNVSAVFVDVILIMSTRVSYTMCSVCT